MDRLQSRNSLEGGYLSRDQQDLLLAALYTRPPKDLSAVSKGLSSINDLPDDSRNLLPDLGNYSLPDIPLHSNSHGQAPDSANMGFLDTEDGSYFDLDGDPDLDQVYGDDLIGDIPDGDIPDGDGGEKRKSLDDRSDPEDGKKIKGNGDKVAKKPGRKPLMSEPTSKRKAQNRAAQRAFRERKEKHLRDLEIKVEELEEASKSANEANSALRSQVARLQVELQEYRKRLAATPGGGRSYKMGFSPDRDTVSNNQGLTVNHFNFEFPKFGDANVRPILSQQTPTIGQNQANNNSGLRYPSSSVSGPSSLFSSRDSYAPSVSSQSHEAGHNNAKNMSCSSSCVSNSNSPSASSATSQNGGVASETSPEPSVHVNSPQLDKTNDGNKPGSKPRSITSSCKGPKVTGERTFCEALGMACGNSENPVPADRTVLLNCPSCSNESCNNAHTVPSRGLQPQQQRDSIRASPNIQGKLSLPLSEGEPDFGTHDPYNLDWLVEQNAGKFDPVLFSDYRDPQDAVLSYDFGSYLDDVHGFDPSFPSPNFNTDELAKILPQGSHETGGYSSNTQPGSEDKQEKVNLMQHVDNIASGGDDEVVPASHDRSQMLNCTKIWDHLQNMPSFQNGEIDVDNLCTELRTKARCSRTGVVIDQKDVDDIVKKVS